MPNRVQRSCASYRCDRVINCRRSRGRRSDSYKRLCSAEQATERTLLVSEAVSHRGKADPMASARKRSTPGTDSSEQEIRQQEVLRANRELAAYFKGRRTEREARAAL